MVSGPRSIFCAQEAVIQSDTVGSTVERAILQTVAYADIFDYPLTAAEVHRYLVGVSAPRAEVDACLPVLALGPLASYRGFYALAGREDLVEIRQRRAAVAARLWPVAIRYGRLLADLPFVRMVAVTGSLAVNNAEAESDIDYLVVTTAGRVWVSQGMTGLLRRVALRRGVHLCPNYVLSEQTLTLQDRNLYTAHELMQMVPLVGQAVYRRMIELNAWTGSYLPNAREVPRQGIEERLGRHPLSRLAEAALRTPAGSWLDRLERRRIMRKMLPRLESGAEVIYSEDCCKGHALGHGQRVLAAFAERLERSARYAGQRHSGNGAQ